MKLLSENTMSYYIFNMKYMKFNVFILKQISEGSYILQMLL